MPLDDAQDGHGQESQPGICEVPSQEPDDHGHDYGRE